MKFFLSLIPLVAMTAAATAPVHTNYTTVTGYFAQDDASTNASTFNYTTTNFGLLNRTYLGDKAFDPHNKKTQWQRFANEVTRLNRQSPANVQYKVLFMGRHGEGYHNVAQTYYGTPAWNCYWSLQDGNGTSTWADPRLTANGIGQAEIAHSESILPSLKASELDQLNPGYPADIVLFFSHQIFGPAKSRTKKSQLHKRTTPHLSTAVLTPHA
ncbi:putative gpi anchored [Phaeomoniella chlamydospora]|uniref:Putative gpi anchored n=1 Tax=Phaeomoniella chlamydospora TaxID=158046 RepID=A0A0G2E8L9_PHACM|nr:putative gpi anchored [Phaeomoniella chlamydospora]